MKVGTAWGTYVFPAHVAPCLVLYPPKAIATVYALLHSYKYAFLLPLYRLIFQSGMEVFPSGHHEKEQHRCTKNVQNYSKRKIKFGLTELSVV